MKSLGITDKQKYGSPVSPASLTSKSPKNSKTFPTVTLTGPQITALGLDDASLGDTGTLELKFVVKHMQAGDRYSSTLGSGSTPTELTLAFTDGHATDEDAGENSEDSDDGDETAPSSSEPDSTDDTGEDDAPSNAEGDGAETDDDEASDTVPSKKETLSPKDAGLDDE